MHMCMYIIQCGMCIYTYILYMHICVCVCMYTYKEVRVSM